MMQAPDYFGRIEQEARLRWQKLDADPGLSGPWKQLFIQVQSPRHVLSELLQNADDAGATEATASFQNGEFIFRHNGADFTESDFDSVCQFANSRKRTLHTIGFRGIGFKSTFSLGDPVILRTKTLSVKFEREHFTLPVWMNSDKHEDGWTEVRVPVNTDAQGKELKRNFTDWVNNPASILFFKTLRSLTIEDEELRWQKQADGPVPGCEWVSLKNGDGRRMLHIRSDMIKFPSDAEVEIRSERDIAPGEDLPGFHIELVLGMTSKLYVILPTQLNLEIPFAINAPFLQDPARSGLKNIALSPTNRWLLQKSGELAATTMTRWIQNSDLSNEDRAKAYRLLITPSEDETTTAKQLRRVVQEGFIRGIDTNRILLSEKGLVTAKNRCQALPRQIMEVWSAKQLKDYFGDTAQQILCRSVSSGAVEILTRYSLIVRTSKIDIISKLKIKKPPRPETFFKIFQLWSYLADEIADDWYRDNKKVAIVPVKGLKILLPYTEVIRLGEKRENLKENDWTYLTQYMLVLDQGWPKYITKLLRESETMPNGPTRVDIRKVQNLMETLELKSPSNTNTIMQRVGAIFFGSPKVSRKDAVKLAHIAARLRADVTDCFQFFTRDGNLAGKDEHVLVDVEYRLEDIVPEDYRQAYFLHQDYHKDNITCTHEEWENWINTGRTSLVRFFPFIDYTDSWYYQQDDFVKALRIRGYSDQINKRYKSNHFEIVEPDFDSGLREYWKSLSADDSTVYARVLEALLQDPQKPWEKALHARANHISQQGTRASVLTEQLSPLWIFRFRELPCLEDSNGQISVPRELHCRTSANEAVLNVESFVRPDLDNENNRVLLEALGVLTTPVGPANVLSILAEFTSGKPSQVSDLHQWYRRLDRILVDAGTDIVEQSIAKFRDNPLIPTNQDEWAKSEYVFLQADGTDDPGLPLIPEDLRMLRMWQTLGVPERPTFELTLAWLESLPEGKPLDSKTLQRLRTILAKQAEKVKAQSKHWLNANEEWVPLDTLKYHYSSSSGIDAAALFIQYRQAIADCTMLSFDLEQTLFGDVLEDLAKVLIFKLGEKTRIIGSTTRKDWLSRFGELMSHVILDRQEDEIRVHEVARRMSQTFFQKAEKLTRAPQIGGAPAGTLQESNVLFFTNQVYHADLSDAKIMDPIVTELGRHLGHGEVIAALRDCYERPVAFVEEILISRFTFLEDDLHEEETEDQFDSEDDSKAPEPAPVEYDEDPEIDEQVSDNDGDGVEPGQAFEEIDNSSNRPTPQANHKPESSLMDRYAAEMGFKHAGNGLYRHADGRRLEYDRTAVFKWQQFSSQGEILFKYGVFEKCWDIQPIEMTAEMWLSFQEYPEDSGVLLLDLQGKPILIEGFDLKQMAAEHIIDLRPAKYRIVKKR